MRKESTAVTVPQEITCLRPAELSSDIKTRLNNLSMTSNIRISVSLPPSMLRRWQKDAENG